MNWRKNHFWKRIKRAFCNLKPDFFDCLLSIIKKKKLLEEKISFGEEYQLENARIDEFDQIFNIINTSYKEDDFWAIGILNKKKKKKKI